MTENERHKVAIVARRLGEALERGLITNAEFCNDMRRLTEVAMILTINEADIIPFPDTRGNA